MPRSFRLPFLQTTCRLNRSSPPILAPVPALRFRLLYHATTKGGRTARRADRLLPFLTVTVPLLLRPTSVIMARACTRSLPGGRRCRAAGRGFDPDRGDRRIPGHLWPLRPARDPAAMKRHPWHNGPAPRRRGGRSRPAGELEPGRMSIYPDPPQVCARLPTWRKSTGKTAEPDAAGIPRRVHNQ
mgnify:FL=1